MVEFSFVFVMVLGFIFLMMDVAWIVFGWACVQEAVREGARAAVTCTPNTGLNASIQSVVEQYSFGFINSANASTVLKIEYMDPSTLLDIPSNAQVASGDVVKISVSGLKLNLFAPIMHDDLPIYVGASSADIMSCSTPASR